MQPPRPATSTDLFGFVDEERQVAARGLVLQVLDVKNFHPRHDFPLARAAPRGRVFLRDVLLRRARAPDVLRFAAVVVFAARFLVVAVLFEPGFFFDVALARALVDGRASRNT